jgi:hypothetical protein
LAEGVSEEKIKMWKVNGRRTTNAKWWQKLKKTCTYLKWSIYPRSSEQLFVKQHLYYCHVELA